MRDVLCIVNVLIWASVSLADSCCDLPGYSQYGTSCFKLYKTDKTWADAEASCVADGGHLASIHSSEEQAFLTNLVADSSSDIWIGVIGVIPNFAWSDNTYLDYTAWKSGDPNDLGEVCGRMRSAFSFLWADRPCSMSFPYMCRADGVDQARVSFTKVPGGVPMDTAAVPASSHMVRSAIGCAVSCQSNAQCVHFILSKDGGKYCCETYTSMVRPPTATPPTDNYQKNC